MFSLRETCLMSDPPVNVQDVLYSHPTSVTSLQRASAPICDSGLSANALISTARGAVPACQLRAGDMVHTKCNGLQPLRWIGVSRHTAQDADLMRLLNADGQRSQTLLIPDQLVFHKDPKAELLFGEAEVLCPAWSLTSSGRFEPDPEATPTLYHLLFDRFELIRIGDFWVASHVPDMPRMRLLAPELAEEMITVLPRLAHDHAVANYLQNRIILDEREVRCLFR